VGGKSYNTRTRKGSIVELGREGGGEDHSPLTLLSIVRKEKRREEEKENLSTIYVQNKCPKPRT
jgi:hypothetical protein